MLVAVAADKNTFLGAFGSAVTLLLAVAAKHLGLCGAVTREVTHFTAVLALDTLSGTWLGAVRGFVARSLAVAASVAILTGIGTRANVVADLLAVSAPDFRLLDLALLFWAATRGMANLLTVEALVDHAIHDEPCRLQALDVVFLGLRVARGELGALWQ